MRNWNHLLTALGVFLLFGAAGRTVYTVFWSPVRPEVAFQEVVIEAILIGLPGAVMVYAGVRLAETTIPSALYPRVAVWTVGGIVVSGIVVGLREFHPGIEVIDYTGGTQLILVSIGSIAGLLAGVQNARTLAQANALERKTEELKEKYELEKRNEKLKRTERRLEEAVAELEASNDRLEEFAYAVSHDLQEPLRMVTSYLRLLEERYEDVLDEDGEEFIEFAVDGAERMRAMIDGLLEYSRIETRGESFEPVALDDVLDDVHTDLQLKIEESDATIDREPLPTVVGDENQLRQVFQNLLDNAIEYSGDDPPRIRISAERGDLGRSDSSGATGTGTDSASVDSHVVACANVETNADADAYTIAVSDDGIGIDPDDTERIFDIFERLHSIDEQSGSGIGLALCRRIVERHGGEIRVDAEPGEGSTFYVTLPCSERTARSATSAVTGRDR